MKRFNIFQQAALRIEKNEKMSNENYIFILKRISFLNHFNVDVNMLRGIQFVKKNNKKILKSLFKNKSHLFTYNYNVIF